MSLKIRSSNSNCLARLFQHISRKRKIQFIALLLVMLVASLAEVISIGALLPFLGLIADPSSVKSNIFYNQISDLFGEVSHQKLILVITIGFISAALFSGVMRVMLLWIQTRLSYAIGADLSLEIYRRTLYQPYEVHLARNSSEVISGIARKADEVVGHTILPLLVIMSSIVMMLAILLVLFQINFTVAASAFLGFGGVYFIVGYISKERLNKYSREVSKNSPAVIKALQEGLGGIRDVLLDGTQTVYCDVYAKADAALRRAQVNINLIGQSPRYVVESVGMVLIAFLAYYLSVDLNAGIVGAIPILGALALGAQRLLPLLHQAYFNLSLMRGGNASLYDALELLDQPMPEHFRALETPVLEFAKSIRIENVYFSYGTSLPDVLSAFNLEIDKGSRVGVIGATGAGKSTLSDLLMGLLSPRHGVIRIDDVSVSRENMRSWQLRIAHVPQLIFLADASISENIAFGVKVEEIDFERVHSAAKKAQIADIIEVLPEGYATLIGERGIRLSGGQRQRIGIARALYKNADVLILDEATSALDGDTEESVMKSIDNLDKSLTIMIVAHRVSTLKACDYIIEIEDGRVKRRGSYGDIFMDPTLEN